MNLEFHQLDRRYEELRAACARRERRVLASLIRHGQQLPVVVVAGGDEGRYILVDGYKRVRALVRLRHDTVQATCWDLPEQEALLLGQLMRGGGGDSALEQGWLLRELRMRFDLRIDELARRFDRSASWVSGRLGLVNDLPAEIQEQVRKGYLVPHAAMKSLLPLARANRGAAIELAAVIAPLRPSSRQTEALCVAFARGKGPARRHLLAHPELFLRAREVGTDSLPMGPGDKLLRDIETLSGIARRALGQLRNGAFEELTPPEREELGRGVRGARHDTERLFADFEEEMSRAGRADESDNSRPPRAGLGQAPDRTGSAAVS